MKIIIVGAGIAGLTAAIALVKKGHNVHIFEQSSLTEKTGLGVGLQDFAVEALLNLGLSQLISHGVLIKRTSFYTKEGDLLFEGSLNASTEKGKIGVRRSELLSVLLETAISLIGESNIHSHCQLISLIQNIDQVEATFVKKMDDSLLKVNADLLIGADGLHSTVRSILFPDSNEIKFSGIVTWRGFTRSNDFLNREMLLMGDRFAKTVIYPVKKLSNQQVEYYWAAEVLQRNNGFSGKLEDKEGRLDEFSCQFEDFRIKNIKITDLYRNAHTILKFPIVDKDPISHWFINRAILIGDAAHPMYPMGGNGASQAIIDAVSLADSLCEKSTVHQALELFSIKRVDKVNGIVMSNRQLGPDKILISHQPGVNGDNRKHYSEIVNQYKNLTHPY